MKKKIILFGFVFLLFILIYSLFVFGEYYYNINTFYDYKNNVSGCYAIGYTGTVSTSSCDLDGESFYDSDINGVTLTAYGANMAEVNFTINLSEKKTYNLIQFYSCDYSQLTPASISFYKINDDNSQTLLATWTNTNASNCADSTGCFINPSSYDVTFTATEIKKLKAVATTKTCTFSGNRRTDFSELNLSYVNYTINNLPIANFSTNETFFCLDNETHTKTINLNINASDFESDTIYYSLDTLNYNLQYIINEDDFSTDENKGDFEFFTRGNFISNNSYPSNSVINNLFVNSGFYYNDYKHALTNVNNNIVLATVFNPSNWSYISDYALVNFSIGSFNLGFPYNNSKIDIFSKNGNGENIFKLTLDYNISNVLNIYIDNVLYNSTPIGRFNSSYGNTIYLSFGFDASLNYASVNIITNSQDINTIRINKSFGTFKGFSFLTHNRTLLNDEFYNAVWIIDNLKISGYNYNPEVFFTTTKPETYEFTNSGTYVLKLYLTDDVHLNGGTTTTNYNSYLLPITVYSDSVCYLMQKTEDIINPSYITAGESLKATNFKLCSGFSNIGNVFLFGFDFCTIPKVFIYILGFILSIVTMIILSYFAPDLILSFSIIAFVFGVWAGQLFIIDISIGEKVFLGVLFALAFAVLLGKIFSGETNSSGGNNG